ncbi:MAG: hypothetical protein WC203_07975 [Candidatus Bathyarchaeia archaeon]
MLFFEKPNYTKSINNISWMGKLIKLVGMQLQTKVYLFWAPDSSKCG